LSVPLSKRMSTVTVKLQAQTRRCGIKCNHHLPSHTHAYKTMYTAVAAVSSIYLDATHTHRDRQKQTLQWAWAYPPGSRRDDGIGRRPKLCPQTDGVFL
jgi:hypothetical protein